MQTVTRIEDMRALVRGWRFGGESIAFVPTMGNLHAGHASLIGAAHLHGRRVVASMFVNPLQFGPNEDYNAYPRTPRTTRSCSQRRAWTCCCCRRSMRCTRSAWPAARSWTCRSSLGILCGAVRPGHFQGVATVVVKLLNLVQPDVAIFGEKDYQQLTIIRRSVEDLCLPVRIVGAPTVRADDGLALSSRNRYLSVAERAIAPRCTAHSMAPAGGSNRATPTSPIRGVAERDATLRSQRWWPMRRIAVPSVRARNSPRSRRAAPPAAARRGRGAAGSRARR
jgi:pantoate--beta-alanine ligase